MRKPNITITDFHKSFIENTKRDRIKHKTNLNKYINKLNHLHDYLKTRQDYYLSKGIPLHRYVEYNEMVYNGNSILDRCKDEIPKLGSMEKYMFLRYIITLEAIRDEQIYIEQCDKRVDMPLKVYREILRTYYNKVHKALLEGNGYTFKNGTGTISINKWVTTIKDKVKPRLDYTATSKNKKQLESMGLKVTNKEDKARDEELGIQNDYIDHRSFKYIKHYYPIEFVTFKYKKAFAKHFSFQVHKFIAHKIRCGSYKNLADKCETIDDICNCNCDLKYKLNMLLYKFPRYAGRYVRNEQLSRYADRIEIKKYE